MARAQLLACGKSWIRPPEWSKFRRWPQPFSESRHQSGMCVTGHHHDLGTCHSQERDAADVGDGLKLPQSRTAFGAASGVREATSLHTPESFGDFSSLCDEGKLTEACQCLERLSQQGLQLSVATLGRLLQGCIRLKDVVVGRQVHALIIQHGYEREGALGDHFVCLYAVCERLQEAAQVFDNLRAPGVYAWAAIISAHVKHGFGHQAVRLYSRLRMSDVKPNDYVFVAAIRACSCAKALTAGRLVEADAMVSGFGSNMFVGSALIGMYARCGNLADARKVFDRLPTKDLVAWSAMIEGYARQGDDKGALELFVEMQVEGMKPNKVTVLSMLKACCKVAALEHGKLLHAYILGSCWELDLVVGSSLIELYCKCAELKNAQEVFDILTTKDLVAWTAMIAGYSQEGRCDDALKIYEQLLDTGMQPDQVTVVTVLKACASVAALGHGKMLHAQAASMGLTSEVVVCNCLIDMYTKCGSLKDARKVFDEVLLRDQVTWTTMIVGYAQHGDVQVVLHLFREMQEEGMKPDKVTLIAALNACSSGTSLSQGKLIHTCVVECGFEADIQVCNSLIDMYAKCGSLGDACRVFNKSAKTDAVSWNCMIQGYAMHGYAQGALHLFQQMGQEGLRPSKVTFICLLSACSHAGLVDDGLCLLRSMLTDFGIAPELEHYVCITDLLGRSGKLEEAEDFINRLPMQPHVALWTSLLGACRTHNNVELGRRAFEAILDLNPTNVAPYVQLSNIYEAAGRLDEKAALMSKTLKVCAGKEPGLTWMECDEQVHVFSANDRQHPERQQVYVEVKRLVEKVAKPSSL